MFMRLDLFIQEKNVYATKLQEIVTSTPDENERNKKVAEAAELFKGQVRKFLPPALNTIKILFQIEYSLYKIGKDFSSEFRVVETNVKKTKSELIEEMEQFKQQATTMSLTPEQMNDLTIAMDILITYNDEEATEYDAIKQEKLKSANVTASSIITHTPKTNIALEAEVSMPKEASHNPYADQPVDETAAAGFTSPSSDKILISNPFATLYGEVPSAPVSVVPTGIDPNQSTISDMSIFGGAGMKSAELDETGIPIHTAPSLPLEAAPMIQQQPLGPPVSGAVEPVIIPQPAPIPVVIPTGGGYTQPIVVPAVNYPSTQTQQPMVMPETSQPTWYEQPVQPQIPNTGVMEYVSANTYVQNEGDYKPKAEDQHLDNITDSSEKSTLLMRLLTGIIIIPGITLLIAGILYFSIYLLSENTDLMDRLVKLVPDPNFLAGILMVIIIILCMPLSGLVTKIVKWRTKYVGKFLMLPIMILVPACLMSPHIIKMFYKDFAISTDFSLTISFYWLIWVLVAIWFTFIIMIRSFLNYCDRSNEANTLVKWNSIEKLSFLAIAYLSFIPIAYLFLYVFKIKSFDNIFQQIYGFDNLMNLASGVSGAFVLIMLILNIVEDVKK